MTTFEYQRGLVSVGSREVNIEGSSLNALKIWFRDRKSTVVLITICVVMVAFMGVLDIGPLTRPLIVAFFVAAGVMVAEFLLKYFDIMENESTIPIDSIEKVSYSQMGRIKPSTLNIHYVDSDDKRQTRKLQLANPIMSSDDRVKQAIEAFRQREIDIETQSN